MHLKSYRPNVFTLTVSLILIYYFSHGCSLPAHEINRHKGKQQSRENVRDSDEHVVSSSTHDADFMQLEHDSHSQFPIYPYQQYVQVRRFYSVEHVPAEDHAGSGSSKSNKFAESNADRLALNGASSDNSIDVDYDEDSDHNYYEKPRLREEIDEYRKNEVYEEKGFSKGAYDHGSYGSYYSGEHDYQQSPSHGKGDENYAESSDRPHRHLAVGHFREPSSTKILQFVASNLHDQKAQKMGSIYAARDDIYCPEVEVNLDSKRSQMGRGVNRGPRPRLHGLGSKIKCMKEKYFGKEPLPPEIFAPTSESRNILIEMPTFDSFLKSMRADVQSMSRFQLH